MTELERKRWRRKWSRRPPDDEHQGNVAPLVAKSRNHTVALSLDASRSPAESRRVRVSHARTAGVRTGAGAAYTMGERGSPAFAPRGRRGVGHGKTIEIAATAAG